MPKNTALITQGDEQEKHVWPSSSLNTHIIPVQTVRYFIKTESPTHLKNFPSRWPHWILCLSKKHNWTKRYNTQRLPLKNTMSKCGKLQQKLSSQMNEKKENIQRRIIKDSWKQKWFIPKKGKQSVTRERKKKKMMSGISSIMCWQISVFEIHLDHVVDLQIATCCCYDIVSSSHLYPHFHDSQCNHHSRIYLDSDCFLHVTLLLAPSIGATYLVIHYDHLLLPLYAWDYSTH